jgi:hypothetical protein
MATVTTPSGEIREGVHGVELEYYQGLVNVGEEYSITDDDAPAEVEQLPEGESLDLSDEHTAEGTGEPNVGVEVPLGETGEVNSDLRPSPRPGQS